MGNGGQRSRLSAEALITQVQEELKRHCNIDIAIFLKKFTIPKALPDLIGLNYGLSPSETQLTSEIFLAGDTLLNGSLNAAMISGEAAAKGLMDVINGLPIIKIIIPNSGTDSKQVGFHYATTKSHSK